MKIAIGSDHAGFALKKEIIPWLEKNGYSVNDVGCKSPESCDYPEYAFPVAQLVAKGEADRGILICGTGIGMAITANRIPGVRAANCGDTFSARSSREHNNANVLTLGERVVGVGLALDIVKVWLETEFSGNERHSRRLSKIESLTKNIKD